VTLRTLPTIAGLLGLLACTAACQDVATRAADPEDPCAWDDPPLPAEMPPSLPQGQEGPLADALPGAWQHTFIDKGGRGYEALGDTIDIRFVFPDGERFVYCQHITGPGPVKIGPATRAAPLRLEGAQIVLPRAPGYTALAWSKDVMLWRNNRRPSETYLLQRR